VAEPIVAERKAEAAGQFSLFGGGERAAHEIDETILHGDEFVKPALLRLEKEVLGQFVTDHPLLSVRDHLARQVDMDIPQVAELGDGDVVTIAGIIGAVARRYTKRGEPYAMFRLEDLAGGVSVIAFPSVYERVPELIQVDRIVLVKGRVDLRGRELQVAASEVREPALGEDGDVVRIPDSPGGLVVEISGENFTSGLLGKLKAAFAAHPGRTPVIIRFGGASGVTNLAIGNGYCVDASAGLLSDLRILLGPERVRMEPALAPN
jgi:DNA polymerase-3 subunit alpha